ncbi:hypothetical protein AA313_de0205417 [Arthrobotrys entomopaga]|nr:hypothetical protein AA313_de0205417 [Arthrobotrys entomopaga]
MAFSLFKSFDERIDIFVILKLDRINLEAICRFLPLLLHFCVEFLGFRRLIPNSSFYKLLFEFFECGRSFGVCVAGNLSRMFVDLFDLSRLLQPDKSFHDSVEASFTLPFLVILGRHQAHNPIRDSSNLLPILFSFISVNQ